MIISQSTGLPEVRVLDMEGTAYYSHVAGFAVTAARLLFALFFLISLFFHLHEVCCL